MQLTTTTTILHQIPPIIHQIPKRIPHQILRTISAIGHAKKIHQPNQLP